VLWIEARVVLEGTELVIAPRAHGLSLSFAWRREDSEESLADAGRPRIHEHTHDVVAVRVCVDGQR
jgi:hypothetical protein